LLYSFVTDGSIYYIGNTIYTSKKRMNGFKNSGSPQKTNLRIKDKLINVLKRKKSVFIYILLDDAKLSYKNFTVSLASGLEDILIRELNPVWNKVGKLKKIL